jgi:hypothetical protein
MKEIELTKGKVAIVDDSIFDILNSLNWFAVKSRNVFYAARHVNTVDGVQRAEYMHHFIIGFPRIKGMMVDHKDGDGLNNQRENLRIVTQRVNSSNRTARRNGKTYSKYIGVTWDKKRNKWIAQIRFSGKNKNLGSFNSEQEASAMYQEAVAALH